MPEGILLKKYCLKALMQKAVYSLTYKYCPFSFRSKGLLEFEISLCEKKVYRLLEIIHAIWLVYSTTIGD